MQEAKSTFWLDSMSPLIKTLYTRFGSLLAMDLDDFQQEAWIVIHESLGKANPNDNPIGYVAQSIRNRFYRLAQNQVRSNALQQDLANEALVEDRYDDQNMANLGIAVRSELGTAELIVFENLLLQKKPVKQLIAEHGWNTRVYTDLRNAVQEKISEHVQAI